MKHTWVDLVFDADSKYIVSLAKITFFVIEIRQILVEKTQNDVSRIVSMDISQVANLLAPTILCHFAGLYILYLHWKNHEQVFWFSWVIVKILYEIVAYIHICGW